MPNTPFLLKPFPKDYLWGGNALNEIYQKDVSLFPFAESWECSTHKDGPSTIASGPYQGMSFTTFIETYPEVLGEHPRKTFHDQLPVLVKLIDAREDLSIQVHPDDIYAYQKEDGQYGKIELWYVLEAEEGATITYGFEHNMTKEKIRQSIAQGTIEKYTQTIPVQKNDIFLIEPGTVHAIGKGIVIAEIQESSNLTYRLYDYDRQDKDGKKRELHIDKALDVIRTESSATPKQPMRVLRYKQGWAEELLGRCAYFQVERILLNTLDKPISFHTEANSYQVFLCIDGSMSLQWDQETLTVSKGSTVFIPANSPELLIQGKAQCIKIGS